MVILLNNKLKQKKKLYISLSKIYGIGYNYSKNLCKRVGLNTNAKIEDLKPNLIKIITKFINNECIIDRELKASINTDIQTKIKLKTYQGRRHIQGLPVNGQNTKNNSKTAKRLLRENADKFKKI